MSLSRIFKVPIKLFKKEVITFLIIRRHDLGVEDILRYVAVRQSASIAALRQKIWHLLDLPDYCEEIIVLKSGDQELPLTELRVGNDPQHPFVLEVWLPETQSTASFHKNMLTMGETITDDGKAKDNKERNTSFKINANPTKSIEKLSLRYPNEKRPNNFQYSDFKKPELGSKISSTSVFKLYRKKSRDSFTNILLKIQSDLSTLSTKLSNLENRMPPS
ncbi:uncharacterized protein LOC128671964 isoform X2 [Plodia interpunctella]|uniref:uncharacterized protein LOC128671964 isoform X2 n=1 Tax=Plodia interpunctella TaxID=58824 RepID=UPI002367BEAB|nr:uncharacterized protein LOC128671964 isoform X2 [Plodia interpunctella]